MALCLPTLVLAVLTSPNGSSLDECIDRSDRIAAMLVTKVVSVRQTLPFLSESEWPRAVIEVAELYVETSFVGPPEEHFVHVVQQDGRAPLHLEPRQRYMLFLERDRTWTHSSEGTRTALAGATHGAPLYQVVSCESVKLRLLHDDGKLADPQASAWSLADLEARVDARLPFLVAHEISTGPAPWMLRIAKDRTVTGAMLAPAATDPARSDHLSEERHRALFGALESQRFDELPDEIGISPGPDFPAVEIELRRRDGPKRIRIYPQDPASIEDAQRREEMRRALAVRDALPPTVGR